jgi:hypothetical protein
MVAKQASYLGLPLTPSGASLPIIPQEKGLLGAGNIRFFSVLKNRYKHNLATVQPAVARLKVLQHQLLSIIPQFNGHTGYYVLVVVVIDLRINNRIGSGFFRFLQKLLLFLIETYAIGNNVFKLVVMPVGHFGKV